jgi:hypothetical protein
VSPVFLRPCLSLPSLKSGKSLHDYIDHYYAQKYLLSISQIPLLFTIRQDEWILFCIVTQVYVVRKSRTLTDAWQYLSASSTLITGSKMNFLELNIVETYSNCPTKPECALRSTLRTKLPYVAILFSPTEMNKRNFISIIRIVINSRYTEQKQNTCIQGLCSVKQV